MSNPKQFIDALPIPLLVVSPSLEIAYMNAQSSRVLSGDGKEARIAALIDLVTSPDMGMGETKWKVLGDRTMVAVEKADAGFLDPVAWSGHTLLAFLPLKTFDVFDDVDAGIYSIGPDGHSFLYLNDTAARIFEYSSPRELLQHTKGSVKPLYVSPPAYEQFMDRLSREGTLQNHPMRMRTRSGREITILVTVKRIHENGKLVRRDGVFTHVEDYDLLQLVRTLPTGAYEVEYQGPKRDIPIITVCNREFATMFGFPGPAEVQNKVDIRDLYADVMDARKFEKEFRESAVKEEVLIGRFVRVKRQDDGHQFWISVNCVHRGDKANPGGRVGTIQDISPLMMTGGLVDAKRVRELIHTFGAPVSSLRGIVKHTHREVMRLMERDGMRGTAPIHVFRREWEPDPKSELQNIVGIIDALYENLKSLDGAARNLAPVFEGPGQERDRDRLDRARKELEYYLKESDPGSRLRDRAFLFHSRWPVLAIQEIVEALRVEAGDEGRSGDGVPLDEISKILHRLDLLTLLYLATISRSEVAMTLLETHNLREYLIGSRAARRPPEFHPVDLEDLLLRAVYAFAPEAACKGLEIRIKTGGSVVADGVEHLLSRMVAYILDNAIKYSFEREGFIRVSLSENLGNAWISVENFGVGMTREEIDTGKLFELGRRGDLAWDRNREGSGIGLAEVKRIADIHNGSVNLESKASGTGPVPRAIPHKNTVTVRLNTRRSRTHG